LWITESYGSYWEASSGTMRRLAFGRENLTMRLNNQVAAKTVAFVLAGGTGRRLNPLTKYRPKPLVPFGGCFRILDFTLSNCFNSEVDCVYVLTQHESESMAAYLRKGWGRFGASKEFAVPRPPANGSCYAGTADAFVQNLFLVREHGCTYALVVSADHVYKMDYRALLSFHAASGADVTIAAADHPSECSSEMGVLQVGEDNRVVGFKEKLRGGQRNVKGCETGLVNMGVYVFNVDALRSTIQAAQTPIIDIAADLIPLLLRSNKVKAYRYEASSNTPSLYWRDVGTVEAYYQASMDLLSPDAPMDPYDPSWPIRSANGPRIWDRSVLSDAGNEIDVNSIIPRAAYIEGAFVYRSVLSLGVVLESGADVRHSVLLPGAVIRRGASVRRAIIDAHVVVEAGDRVGYSKGGDQSRFHVTPNGVVVVSPDHVAPFFTTEALNKAEFAV
jgi:glucose-1-phosphate adenylyltransferase